MRASDTVKANIDLIKEKQNKLDELCALEIGELPLPEKDPETLDALRNFAAELMPADDRAFGICERLEYCQRICRRSHREIVNLLFPASSYSFPRSAAYVNNQYSADAFDLFFGSETKTERKICASFAELCDEVSSSDTDACIIPIEDTSGGKLMNFYSIIDRFDLKITMTCDIEYDDGSRLTRYALLEREIRLPAGGDCFFEVGLNSRESLGVDGLIRAAGLLGLGIHRMDSIPVRYNETSFTFYPVFCGRLDNIIEMAFFLSLNTSQCTYIGIYNHIK